MYQPKSVQESDRVLRLRQQLVEQPNDSQTLYNLGTTFSDQQKFDVAVGFLCQAVAAEQKNPMFYTALGNALQRSGRNLEAGCAFRQALALDGNLASAYNGLGVTLRQAGDLDLALGSLQAAIRKAPNSAQYWADLAATLCATKDYRAAEKAALKARSLDPKLRYADRILIEIWFGAGRIEAAIRRLRKMLQQYPDWSEPYYHLGRAYVALNRLPAGKRFFARALSLNPHDADTKFCIATCQLAAGNFRDGWKAYEDRFRLGMVQQSPTLKAMQQFAEPMWAGENLIGKTLLVWGEQGFGDTLQFIRFASEVAKQQCRVIVVTYPELVPLLRLIPSITSVISYDDLIPRFDHHIALCSLPRVLNTTLKTIPCGIPYIPIPNVRKSLPELQKDSGFRVGFVWSTRQGNTLDCRNVPIRLLESLFRCQWITFYSFQINERADELKKYSRYSNVRDLRPYIDNFRDTAYLVSKMNLVISIDSVLAHLAGALGIPVWLMLPYGNEWRWLSVSRRSPWFDKTPWYPTIRLFRAPSFNAWQSVLRQIRKQLVKISQTVSLPSQEPRKSLARCACSHTGRVGTTNGSPAVPSQTQPRVPA